MVHYQKLIIKSILIDGQGYFYVEENEPTNYLGSPIFKLIEPVEQNGEMAMVRWFNCYDYNDKLVKEINGKYVIEINYQ
jgi:hypothetical protein